jgi:hypothetical protein
VEDKEDKWLDDIQMRIFSLRENSKIFWIRLNKVHHLRKPKLSNNLMRF